MSDQTTNPTQGESSLSINQAAEAISNLLKPKESPKDQPSEPVAENAASEDSSTEATQVVAEESQDQPDAASEGVQTDEDEFLIGEEKVKASQLKEWKESGLRLQDYTKKTQELAQQRKEFEEWKAKEEQAFRQQWTERLVQFADVVADELAPFEKVDWDKLRQEDPYQYQNMWVDFQRAQMRAQQAQQSVQQALSEEQSKRDAERQRMLQAQANEAKKVLPDLADPAKAGALISEMTSYLKDAGMSPEEISEISDHRALKIIYDAMQWQKTRAGVQKAPAKKVVAVTKVVKPGSPHNNREVRSERSMKVDKELHNRLRNSGRINDAAELIARRMR